MITSTKINPTGETGERLCHHSADSKVISPNQALCSGLRCRCFLGCLSRRFVSLSFPLNLYHSVLLWRNSARLFDGKSESRRAKWGVQGCGRRLLTKLLRNAAKHSRLFFFLFPVSHLVTELPPSQRWSWEEAPSRLLVSRKALNSGQQSTPCNTHHKHFQLKLETYKPLQFHSTTAVFFKNLTWTTCIPDFHDIHISMCDKCYFYFPF